MEEYITKEIIEKSDCKKFKAIKKVTSSGELSIIIKIFDSKCDRVATELKFNNYPYDERGKDPEEIINNLAIFLLKISSTPCKI